MSIKFKKVISFVVSAFLVAGIVVCFNSCSDNNKEKIVGEWKIAEGHFYFGTSIPKNIIFNSDGSIYINGDIGGTYTLDGNNLNVFYTTQESYSYKISFENEVLFLRDTDNSFHTYEKVISSDGNSNFENQQAQEITEPTTEEPRLSDNYKVLADGSNLNGDFYELVFLKEVTASSVTLKVGVIKNNKWLRELSEESPFIVKDSSGRSVLAGSSSLYSFIGNSTFRNGSLNVHNGGSVIYNVETQKTYCDKFEDLLVPCNYTEYQNTGIAPSELDYNKVVLRTRHKDFLDTRRPKNLVLDTTTMSTTTIDNGEINMRGLFSEGLVYGQIVGKNEGFYSVETGKLVIDLSQYGDIMTDDSIGFINGKAVLYVLNHGNSFLVTIDKTGKVLSEEKID